MTKHLTSTNASPTRINATHYRIESQDKDRLGRAYDLVFNQEQRRWTCNCPDTRHNHNPRCKHVRRLADWIKEQKAAENRIQAQASAVAEQAFAQVAEPEPEYREYGPALPFTHYFTELDDRLARLEGRMQANVSETALVGDQLAQLVKANGASEAAIARWMAQEAEKRQALTAELQAVREELIKKIDDVYHVSWEYANEIRKNGFERSRKQQEEQALLRTQVAELAQVQPEIEALRTQMAELVQVQPVRISAQAVMVESKNGTKRVASPQEAKPEAQPQIKELQRDGRFVGLEVDGHEVRVAHGMVMGCHCPEGQDRPCQHCKQAEAYLAKKRETAPLNGNKPFSLMR